MVVEALEVLNTILEMSSQQPTLLLLSDGGAGGGRGRASVIITAEQLEPFILGGSQIILGGTDTVFSLFWKAFPETNSGYDNYAG